MKSDALHLEVPGLATRALPKLPWLTLFVTRSSGETLGILAFFGHVIYRIRYRFGPGVDEVRWDNFACMLAMLTILAVGLSTFSGWLAERLGTVPAALAKSRQPDRGLRAQPRQHRKPSPLHDDELDGPVWFAR